MKKSMVWVVLATLFTACAPDSNNLQVHLKGRLLEMGSRSVEMEYSGVSGDFGKSKNMTFLTDNDGYFDTTFVLPEPGYFYISRNILYLSPGDDMEVYLTTDTRVAKFSGKGSAANTFLQDRLYPKGGSFLGSGEYVRANFEQTKSCVDSLAALKLAQLDTLSGVTELFKENERMRIKANVLNSYLSYTAYNKENKEASREEKRNWHAYFIATITPDVNTLMKEIAKDKYLDITDLRDVVIYNLNNQPFFSNVEVTPRMREIAEAQNVLAQLDASTDPTVIAEMEKTIQLFQDTDIIAELKQKIEGVKSLMPTQPAHDIVMTDTTGKEVLLSSFRGKNIYLDCWATWCGPCIEESPAFAALEQKYRDKDIVFIQLSTDNSRKSWLSYLKHKQPTVIQYNSVDNEGLRNKWQVKYIPRFILIDKNFTIVNAFALRPSEPGIEACLDELLSR